MEQYGFVVAADALGQLIFSPIFGLIADRLDSIRLVSLICCLTFCLGNALYANVSLVSADLLGRAFDMVKVHTLRYGNDVTEGSTQEFSVNLALKETMCASWVLPTMHY